MESKYLIALDLGTSSIGYVVFQLDSDNHPSQVLDTGVRIFPDGREPKTKTPLAVARRAARGIRRTRDRGQNRVRRLVRELIESNLLPADDQGRKSVFDSVCPYSARNDAVNNEVDAHTLGRALFHLGRRRGFKSNRLSPEESDSDFKEKISSLRDALCGGTLGEYLFKKMNANNELVAIGDIKAQQAIRFKGGETEFYADRKMYQDEFQKIKEIQGDSLLSAEQWDLLEETIFWQYPLKPVPKGKCRFYPESPRAHIDLPISHQFRINQEINSLRYTSDGQKFELDQRQRDALYHILDTQKTLSFKALTKKKDAHGSPLFPANAVFNLDTDSRADKLKGNSVLIDLRQPSHLGSLADELSNEKLNSVIHYLIEPLKTTNGKSVIAEESEVADWLTQELPSLSKSQIKTLNNSIFKRGTAALSRKAMLKLVPILREQGCTYDKAIAQLTTDDGEPLHHSHFINKEYDELPYYGEAMPESVWGEQPESDQNKSPSERDEDAFQYGKIANPTVHVALNQLRVVVNSVIKKNGVKPQKIHIELTRDLKNSKESRERISKNNALHKKNNDRIRKFLSTELDILNPSRADIIKVKLWEELGGQGARICVFTGQAISAVQLFNGSVEVEHIIPFSRCYDDGFNNKTLAFKSINNQKLNRTPDEAFSGGEYNAIIQRAHNAFGKSSKYKRFEANAFEEFYGADKDNMIERQLNDTKYISRKARQYLSCICPDITSVNGQMTAVMRDVWQLNRFKNREKGHYRDDHRHHIVDAFVVGLTSRKLIRELMTRRSNQEQTRNNLYHFLKSRAASIDALKEQLDAKLETTIASYKPDHTTQGSMFNDTAYGFGKDDDGEPVNITKKSVASLSHEEVFRVRGKHYRHRLINYLMEGEPIDTHALKIRESTKQLKAKVGNDKALAKKLDAFAKQAQIKRVRINVYNSSVTSIQSAPFKGYALNGYAYCDVWKIPHKQDRHSGRWTFRYEGSFIPFANVKEYNQHPKRPIDKHGRSHPAAKRLMRLYKNDSVELVNFETGEQMFMRIAGYASTINKLDIRPNLDAGNAKQNFKSINVIFSTYKVRKLRSL
mgnify:FL=1